MFNNNTKYELKHGNPEAFKKVYRLLYPRLKAYCRLFIFNEHDADDVIQDSFISLWDKKDSIKVDKSIESFVFVIVRNKCLNYLKNKKLERGWSDMENLTVLELQFLYQLDFSDREEKSMEEMLLKTLSEAIEDLPFKMRIVFKKCKIEGQKQIKVADELNISLKMVEKHIAKAKLQIREKLLKQYSA